MTKRLRGTWHAWHFQFALGLVVKVLCGHFCIACLRPLTRRYMPIQVGSKNELCL
ncbi:DUF3265 domain-containing protein [Vibrio parahaemolyticus]|nr:DUF3265 domain-containing protein [Vibrio parahaemolyticus]MCI9711597.1 DUF3265 domain-containing protein [Vibrio parahaemolyticus]MCI9716455.1 DUF3265 domain-containing protein [Vibrio parahaemolyticus]MCR9989654.1 DUF3265 domain-containing protein [Vibrio parahaemolyticus]HBC3426906.1 DUF3265 domain-containing protein [Vibrio parahaemolyticus]